MLQSLVASGTIAWVALAVLAAEFVALSLYFRVTGRGVSPRNALPMLLAGAGLWGALAAALTGAEWIWVALGATVALMAHVFDLAVRWRR
ncbi:MAG: hypothetical protein NXI19_13010 [Alphaproteobacteria bacterium]|nr:hypothetical protein [Alphaproteobacteria bacterium]